MTDEKMTDNRALFYSQPLITVLAAIEDRDKIGEFQLGRGWEGCWIAGTSGLNFGKGDTMVEAIAAFLGVKL